MKTEYPLFTVIIPQKNRAEYLIHTLRTCMIQDYPNFEVIVADDCSDDDSVEVVKELQKKDSRIRIIAHDHHVGMRDNFEIALNEVKEGYVMALGGDDGLVPGCIWRMYEIIKETGTELLTWVNAGYVYPMEENPDGLFTVPRRTFNGVKILKGNDFLNKISRSMYYMDIECPMFYIKGVASINLVNRVKSRTLDGSFYYCPTPDGFSGVVLAGEAGKYAFTREPLSIGGGSPKSQGRYYKRTDAESRKESQQFFDDNVRRTMHKELASQPYSPLITLMTADYLLTARDLPDWPGKFNMFTWDHVIRKSFEMVIRNPFENETLIREMRILREIAIQHDELPLFNQLLKTTKRKLSKPYIVKNFLMTKNVFEFNAKKYGINNIFDAAISVPFAYEAVNGMNPLFMVNWMKETANILLNRRFFKTQNLPSID